MRDKLYALWNDERGQEERIGNLLVFAFIAIPIIALLIMFGRQIMDFLHQAWIDLWGKGTKGT